jgi:4-hydroxythreonine-4-phosphate dehydrogenase
MRPLALTLGEPAGVGPELTLNLWTRRAALDVPYFAAIGDPALLAARAKLLGLSVPLAECSMADVERKFPSALPVIPAGNPASAAPGKPDHTSAQAAMAAVERAVKLVQAGEAAAVVTNPIAKAVMYEAGFEFPGHTEYLAHLAARPGQAAPRPVMLIWSDLLAVVPVTIHVPIRDVPRRLSTELIVETGRIVARDYAARFELPAARIAVCGLNPHAGESGTIGDEDEKIVAPAVRQLIAERIAASGPHPADTLFHTNARKHYDVALGMYHDQVLVPAKTLAFDRAVNVTLGLPFIRTSPDHGTAFDIAGTGRANPASLLAALRLARRLADAHPARA